MKSYFSKFHIKVEINHFCIYIVKYSKVQTTETTQKTEQSFILLKLFKEKISSLALSSMNVRNRHSVEGLGHMGSNKPWLLYETTRIYIQS